ncbi:TRAP transporter large permease [Salinicola endophyticus]|uniref:TRAP transporter large permease protein n=1 Tax=Salinicola endophyticus TaxID=1949083 RepID=A0ABY8FI49_9GAMM|nr:MULTISPECIES: TRAP transporter large permease [Salinicola]WFF41710.1 TRAP transporter large permease [Salinicola endophyticus]
MLAYLAIGILALLLTGIPVAIVLFLLAFGVDQFFSFFPLMRALGQNLWSAADSFLLIAIPLFVLMGEIIVRAGIAERAYRAMDHWLSWLPGGLLHANVMTSMLFSATSGSSVATAATISTVALPQGDKLGYHPRLFCGSIAAGGTLGILIPPSINLIVYGFLTETSIPKLFVAGLLPGLLLTGLFMLTAILFCTVKPSLGGPRRRSSWPERLRHLKFLLPLLVLFIAIVGSIYTGWATPTEAAAIGVLVALILAAFNRRLDWRMLTQALDNTVRTTSMILFIMLAASFLNFALASAGLSGQLTQLLTQLELSPMALLLCVLALLVILGFFIETLSMMVITLPIIAPLLFAAGFDKVWFGVVMILFVEMALITPPVGLNLYIVQAARRGKPFSDVVIGTLPFIAAMVVMAVLLILFPGIALWLPNSL